MHSSYMSYEDTRTRRLRHACLSQRITLLRFEWCEIHLLWRVPFLIIPLSHGELLPRFHAGVCLKRRNNCVLLALPRVSTWRVGFGMAQQRTLDMVLRLVFCERGFCFTRRSLRVIGKSGCRLFILGWDDIGVGLNGMVSAVQFFSSSTLHPVLIGLLRFLLIAFLSSTAFPCSLFYWAIVVGDTRLCQA
jgi:hypothetical protein